VPPTCHLLWQVSVSGFWYEGGGRKEDGLLHANRVAAPLDQLQLLHVKLKVSITSCKSSDMQSKSEQGWTSSPNLILSPPTVAG